MWISCGGHLELWWQKLFSCTYECSVQVLVKHLLVVLLCRRRRAPTELLSTSTSPTWSWSPCCCSRRWTCRSSRRPLISRRRGWRNVRRSWRRSSCRFETWRTTSTTCCCGSWSRRRRCFKFARDTSDAAWRRLRLGAKHVLISQPSRSSHCKYCPADVDAILPIMHAGYNLSLAQTWNQTVCSDKNNESRQIISHAYCRISKNSHL